MQSHSFCNSFLCHKWPFATNSVHMPYWTKCALWAAWLSSRNPHTMNESATIDELLINHVSLCLTVLVQFHTFDCMWSLCMLFFFLLSCCMHKNIIFCCFFLFSFFCFPPCLFSPCCMKDEGNLWKLSVCLDIGVSVNQKPEERWRTY